MAASYDIQNIYDGASPSALASPTGAQNYGCIHIKVGRSVVGASGSRSGGAQSSSCLTSTSGDSQDPAINAERLNTRFDDYTYYGG